MNCAERGGRLWSVLLGLSIVILTSRATAQGASVPARVEMVLVGIAQEDSHIGERVRTLFTAATAVELRVQPALSSVEVLEPVRSDTVYVFVTFGERNRALIYVATRDAGEGAARYLLRDVELASGLDEIGAETVAQVAHSSVVALFSRAAQTSEDALAEELAREEQREPAEGADAIRAVPTRAPVAPSVVPRVDDRGEARVLAARFGVELAAHLSGDEGWLVSPGAHAGVIALDRFGLRLQASYVLPSRFEVPPALVRISGFGLEARASAFVFRSRELRARVDAGGGVLWVHWEAEAILSAEGSDWELASEREARGYLLAGIAVELPVGSLLDAALRTELRLLTPKAQYNVVTSGDRETRAEAVIAPGLALELSFPQWRAGD